MYGSLLAMPIIVLNMGGEMIYILHQRLQAQNVPEEKSRKVLEDVVRTMYTPLFLEELFKPQEIYSVASTKQIFEKLAHSSIMRLNKTSMDKLYDLMTMGVKFQIVSCKSPHQYLQVTLNHLDSLVDMVKSDGVTSLIQIAISKSIDIYSQLTNGNWLLLQQVLHQFFQGRKIKVSLFLQQNLQTLTGVLVVSNKGSLPFGAETPGQVRYFENGKVVQKKSYDHTLSDQCYECQEVLDSTSRLGCNMYLKAGDNAADNTFKGEGLNILPVSSSINEASRALGSKHRDVLSTLSLTPLIADPKINFPSTSSQSKLAKSSSPRQAKSSAKAELTLLSDLLGFSYDDKAGSKDTQKPFKINLFANQPFVESSSKGETDLPDENDTNDRLEEEEYSKYTFIDIDGTADAKTIDSYMKSLGLDDGAKSSASAKGTDRDDDDLLALMDGAK
eukprot:gene12081-16167_t